MAEHVDREYDTIHFGDPVVLLCRMFFIAASAVLLWDAAGALPTLLVPHAGPPGDAFTSPAAGFALFVVGWVAVTALTLVVTRRRRRGAGA